MDHAAITLWRSIPEEVEAEQTGVPLTTSEWWAPWYDKEISLNAWFKDKLGAFLPDLRYRLTLD
jgi:hypothetical protein